MSRGIIDSEVFDKCIYRNFTLCKSSYPEKEMKCYMYRSRGKCGWTELKELFKDKEVKND